MSIQDYLDKIMAIENSLLAFLGQENNDEENFQNLFKLLDNHNIYQDMNYFKTVLYLISKISKNFPHSPYFFCRIEQILQKLRSMKDCFSNSEIFRIFKGNKRILLFLFEEKILVMDKYIFEKMNSFSCQNAYYPKYFEPEITTFLENEKLRGNTINKKLPENFYEKRKIAENDSAVCELIRRDIVKDFIAFIKKNDFSLNAKIEESVYETNRFLIKQGRRSSISLIKYAAFFGSVNIFKYLIANEVEITSGILKFAIHGQNEEIIHLIEQNDIKPTEYNECFYESIKCYQNDAANYIQNNYLQSQIDNQNSSFRDFCFKCYNFVFLPNNFVDESLFYSLCKNGFYILVDIFIQSKSININKKNSI